MKSVIALILVAGASLATAQTTKGIGEARRAAGAMKGSGASGDASSADGSGGAGGVSAGRGKLTVVNGTPWVLIVRMGDATLGEVAAGGRQEFQKIAVGSRLVTVATREGHRRWGPTEAFVTREGGELQISEAATTGVKVVNHTGEPLVVLEGGKLEPVATVAAGEPGVFASMKPGTYKFGARSASGKLQYSPRFLVVSEGQLTEWTVGSH